MGEESAWEREVDAFVGRLSQYELDILEDMVSRRRRADRHALDNTFSRDIQEIRRTLDRVHPEPSYSQHGR